MTKITYGRQFIDSEDIKTVNDALKAELITTGKYVKKFEEKIVKLLKCNYAVSCNSGTSALHLALSAIDLKKKDVVIMPAINFIAVYNLSSFMGANIYLADVDPLTGQMTPETLLDCINKNKITKIKTIITMFLGGYPENVLNFYKIKKKYKCFLIEDACHALGAKYKYGNKKAYVGSCQHADISCFSLHPVKTITSGEGGIITTNSKNFFKKINLLRSHGIVKNKLKYWEYDISNVGFNYRLSDINCALGFSQIKKIKQFTNYRKKVSEYYTSKLKNFLHLPSYNSNNEQAYHLFLISINFKKINCSKDKFLKYLNKKKIFCQYHYIPLYRFKLFPKKNFSLKGSEYYYQNTLSIPIYYNLDLTKQNKVINVIKNYLKDKINL